MPLLHRTHRIRLRRFSGLLLLGCGIACAKDPLKPSAVPPPFKATVDFSPTWSKDGQMIAYRRVYPSTDGLPGIYVISKRGGKPVFITGANFLWPEDLSFSPDGQYLSAAIDLQLAIIDLSSGNVSMPMYTDNWVRFTDWSPDGRFIVYSRIGIVTGEPPDSAGVHIYEPATGRDWPIVHDGEVVIGRAPRWSPDGRWIAFIRPSTNEVGIVRPDGSERRTLFQGECVESELRWYRRRLTGADGVVFIDLCRGTYFVDVEMASATLTHPLGRYDEFSPDGSELVTLFSQPTDSLGVVFTQSVDDFSGATRFQVTHYTYAPPPPSSAQLSRAPRVCVQPRGMIP